MIEDLFLKRKQIRHYKQDTYPDENLMESLFEKAFKLVPSKQSLMPYKVHVLGPDQGEVKDRIYHLSTDQDIDVPIFINHQLKAPYVLIFTQRLAEPSPQVAEDIKNGHLFYSCDPEFYTTRVPEALVEMGMFCTVLTGLAMEQDIDVSYTMCLERSSKKYQDAGLRFIDEEVCMGMSLGYEVENKYVKSEKEFKPNMDKVILWN